MSVSKSQCFPLFWLTAIRISTGENGAGDNSRYIGQLGELSCADQGIFVSWGGGGGGAGCPGRLAKKALTLIFFFVVLSLFYRSQMVNLKEIYLFSRFQRGSNIFRGGGGGATFSRGVQLLIPYRNPSNLWFSRGVRTPCPPPSGSALDSDNSIYSYQLPEFTNTMAKW